MNRYICCGEIRDGAVVVRRLNEGVHYSCETYAPHKRQYVHEVPYDPFGLVSGFRRGLPSTAREAHAEYIAFLMVRVDRQKHRSFAHEHYEQALTLPYVVEEMNESVFDVYKTCEET